MLSTSTRTRIHTLLPKGRFVRAVGVLAGGSVASQLLIALAAPLLTRLYTPDDFGLVAVYLSLVALLSVIASLRYELAIPLQETDTAAGQVLALGLLILSAVTVVVVGVALVAGENVAVALGVPGLAEHSWLVPVGILLSGAYTLFSYCAIRAKMFRAIARTTLAQTVTMLAIQLLGFKAGGLSLMLGNAGGRGVGAIFLGATALGQLRRDIPTWPKLKQVAWRYRRFPAYATWSGLFSVAGQQLPPLMFASLFGPAAAGLYALTHRMLSLSSATLGKAVANVFFSSAAKSRREGTLGPLVEKVFGKLVHLAAPPALLLILTAPDLFAFVFGEQWREAGDFARWLTPALLLSFISSPISTVFTVSGKQRQGMVFQAALLASRVLALGVGAWLGDVLTAVACFSIASVLCYLVLLRMIFYYAGSALPVVVKAIGSASVFSFLCVVANILALVAAADSTFTLLAFAVSAALIALRYVFLMRQM